MTYQGGEFSQEALLQELKETVQRENVRSFDAYIELIDELIEEKKKYGFFAEEEDTQQIKNDLRFRWPEVEAKLPKL